MQHLEPDTATVEPAEPVTAADDAIVEPTEPVSEPSIDESIARGLDAGINLLPMRDYTSGKYQPGYGTGAAENRPPERELDLGEEDGRAV
ncbi:hypothetical protein [Rhodococcus spongiicola]|uniref:Uncharacterized protein n=1 Tax=Rhodococcus spongiicola TaxID=2487352 RepID=A0A3S3E3C7_9NOCA|nr:hypothetical protein [Rhodococcus spongiicola]RVW04428.1 hypothetical protein EF834_04915 [Rhodococcus spongiicola]